MRRSAQTAAVTPGRAWSAPRRESTRAHEHPWHRPAQGAPDRPGARVRPRTRGLQPSARLAGRRSRGAVRVLLRAWAHDQLAEHERIRRACGSVCRDARSRHPRFARRRLAARAARKRRRHDGVELTTGGAARRASAHKVRAASQPSSRLQRSGRACAKPDIHPPTELLATAFACARSVDEAQQTSTASPG